MYGETVKSCRVVSFSSFRLEEVSRIDVSLKIMCFES